MGIDIKRKSLPEVILNLLLDAVGLVAGFSVMTYFGWAVVPTFWSMLTLILVSKLVILAVISVLIGFLLIVSIVSGSPKLYSGRK